MGSKARFEESKHRRGPGGKFADKPGAGNDAPKKIRTEVPQDETLRITDALEDGPKTSSVIEEYTTSGYVSFTNTLRGGRPGAIKRIQSQLDEFDPLFEKPGNQLSGDVDLYRGVSSTKKIFGPDGPKPGAVVTDPSYMSTSATFGGAHQFISGQYTKVGRDRALFKIRVPKGYSAVRGSLRESEVILPRGSRMKVVSVERKTEFGKSFDLITMDLL
jgi:hypothetical protein